MEVWPQLIAACADWGVAVDLLARTITKRREEENHRRPKKQKKMARRYDARTTIFSPEGTSARAAKGTQRTLINFMCDRRASLPGRVCHGGHQPRWCRRGHSGQGWSSACLRKEARLQAAGAWYPTTHLLSARVWAWTDVASLGALKGKRSEKMYRIDDHIACAVAGITADANILLNFSRLAAQRYSFLRRCFEAAVP